MFIFVDPGFSEFLLQKIIFSSEYCSYYFSNFTNLFSEEEKNYDTTSFVHLKCRWFNALLMDKTMLKTNCHQLL